MSTPSDERRSLAHQVARAHLGLDPSLLSYVSGSVVEDLADALSDVDMSVIFERLPDEASLRAACAEAGGEPWFWSSGSVDEGGLVVAFQLQGVEIQIGYANRGTLDQQLDELLVSHNPDTPLHKLGEGILKAEALAGSAQLEALQRRLSAFPPELARAMVSHWASQPTPWRAITQLLHRDAGLWCRELLVEAGFRQLGVLAGLNRRYFTRFQLKRTRKLVDSFALAPPRLAERLDLLLQSPVERAFAELFSLEGEVLALVAAHLPEVDLAAAQARRAAFLP